MNSNSIENLNENFYLNYSNCKLDDPNVSALKNAKKNQLLKINNRGDYF